MELLNIDQTLENIFTEYNFEYTTDYKDINSLIIKYNKINIFLNQNINHIYKQILEKDISIYLNLIKFDILDIQFEENITQINNENILTIQKNQKQILAEIENIKNDIYDICKLNNILKEYSDFKLKLLIS